MQPDSRCSGEKELEKTTANPETPDHLHLQRLVSLDVPLCVFESDPCTRYAPALRPLRPSARIVRFKKPQPAIIVNRLRQICDQERVKSDIRGLTRLAEMTNGDVRSCLNTLQVSEQVVQAATFLSL